jgi:hypothetical protein
LRGGRLRRGGSEWKSQENGGSQKLDHDPHYKVPFIENQRVQLPRLAEERLCAPSGFFEGAKSRWMFLSSVDNSLAFFWTTISAPVFWGVSQRVSKAGK